ncbi:MAG: DUF2306 domain-containing protein [Cyclobacteriaceae bacterium]
MAKKFGVWLLGSIIFLLIVTLSINAFSYLNFNFTYGFLRLKQEAIQTGWYLPAYYSHIIIAGFILLIGFFQLNTKISLREKWLHRFLGKCYAYGIFLFAAPGGIIMSFFINRGTLVLLSFLIQSILWVVFTAYAIKAIKNGDIIIHKKWMWRSYALTFAAVTLRLYAFATSWSVDLTHPTAYAIIAWLSWTLNLIFVELYLRTHKRVDINISTAPPNF